MMTVGSFDAKTHLPALLERVAKGEIIQITKRGVPVARLIPAAGARPGGRRELAADIRAARQGVLLGGLGIRELINKGRRH